MARRNQPRGQSRDAARCAILSTFALVGCAATQGTLRALLAFLWVVLLIAALALEWNSRRRRARVEEPAPAKGRGRRAGNRAP